MTFHIASINCAELEGGNINSDLCGPETTSSLIADQHVAPVLTDSVKTASVTI